MQLHRKIDDIRAAGAELHVIGNGSVQFMAGFRDQTGWDGPLYTDPSLLAFAAAGLQRGVMRTLDPRSMVRVVKALAGGRRQGGVQGDAWQQGGVVIVDPGGEVRWHQVSARSGDNATADEIIDGLRTS